MTTFSCTLLWLMKVAPILIPRLFHLSPLHFLRQSQVYRHRHRRRKEDYVVITTRSIMTTERRNKTAQTIGFHFSNLHTSVGRTSVALQTARHCSLVPRYSIAFASVPFYGWLNGKKSGCDHHGLLLWISWVQPNAVIVFTRRNVIWSDAILGWSASSVCLLWTKGELWWLR